MSGLFTSKTFQFKTSQSGKALAPVLLIVFALMISALVFFLVTKPKLDQAQETAQQSVSAPVEVPAPEVAPVAPPVEKAHEVAPKPKLEFARPADVGAQLLKSLAAEKMDEAAKIIAPDQPELEAVLKKLFEDMKAKGVKVGPPDQLLIVGQTENATRLSIPLLKEDGTLSTERLLIDVIRDPKMGWKVDKFRLPLSMEAAVAEAAKAAAPQAKEVMSQRVMVEKTPDALTFASDFVHALLKPDYDAARKVIHEEKLSAVKLAALCMVFEDGNYQLQANRPLAATVATEDTSWIIAKVQSPARNEQTEFGIEMEKVGEQWKVIALNLSQLLSDSAKPAAMSGLPYTPLVKNPKGGESIAMYFEYDSAVLGERARKQLEIIGEMLKASPQKKLKISGHTDALGSDAYNTRLSQERAMAVKNFFKEFGVALDQVETVGLGKELPLSPNVKSDGSDNPEGRSHNRRAEILLDF